MSETILETTAVPESERTSRYDRGRSKNTDTRVELVKLAEKHGSGMSYEVRIIHPEFAAAQQGATAPSGENRQAPEVHRFRDEKSARDAYDAYVRALMPEQ